MNDSDNLETILENAQKLLSDLLDNTQLDDPSYAPLNELHRLLVKAKKEAHFTAADDTTAKTLVKSLEDSELDTSGKLNTLTNLIKND